MPSNEHPSIVVIGGTGATGREIMAAMRGAIPHARICAAARRAAPDMETLILDVEAPSAESLRELSRFDLALIALGPFHIVRERAHRLCIENGLDCVDVVDCPDTAREIFALDSFAKAKDVRVLTGMGLNPGLSTLLLALLLDASPDNLQHVRVRLFAGGDEPAGHAATQMMLHQFGPEVEEYRDGKALLVTVDDDGEDATYQFPEMAQLLPAIHCTSAEPAMLAAGWNAAILPKRIDYRIHFQGMTSRVARNLRRSASWRGDRATAALCRVFLALHRMARGRPGNLSSSLIMVDGGPTKVWANGRSVFGLTAAFAAVISSHLLANRDGIPSGIHSMSPAVMSSADACAALATAGIRVEVQ